MRSKAFTLIEILIVVAIVGILSGIVVVSMSDSQEKARIAKIKGFSDSMRNSGLNSLAAEFRFENNYLDNWRNNDSGSAYGDPEYKSGSDCVSDLCLEFDGSDYISVANNDLNMTDELTVEAWVKFDDFSGPPYILSKGVASSDGWYWRVQTNGSWNAAYCWNGGSSYPYPSPAIILSAGEWTHLVTVFDNLNPRIDYYKNGEYAGYTIPTQSFIGNASRALYIGSYNGSYRLNGSMDEVRIYNKALDISQIQNSYMAGLKSLLSSDQIAQEEYTQRLLSYEE